MPDESGKLTTDEQDKIIGWVKDRSHGKAACPLCGGAELGVGNQLVAPVPINAKAKLVAATMYPLVTLTCRRCQHVSFLNVTGII